MEILQLLECRMSREERKCRGSVKDVECESGLMRAFENVTDSQRWLFFVQKPCLEPICLLTSAGKHTPPPQPSTFERSSTGGSATSLVPVSR